MERSTLALLLPVDPPDPPDPLSLLPQAVIAPTVARAIAPMNALPSCCRTSNPLLTDGDSGSAPRICGAECVPDHHVCQGVVQLVLRLWFESAPRSGTLRHVVAGPSQDERPTLEDVAAYAGVSRSTASRALNDDAYVSNRSREVVLAAAAALGYSPNHAARSLVTKRTGAVALVLSEPEARVLDYPYFAMVIHGAF